MQAHGGLAGRDSGGQRWGVGAQRGAQRERLGSGAGNTGAPQLFGHEHPVEGPLAETVVLLCDGERGHPELCEGLLERGHGAGPRRAHDLGAALCLEGSPNAVPELQLFIGESDVHGQRRFARGSSSTRRATMSRWISLVPA